MPNNHIIGTAPTVASAGTIRLMNADIQKVSGTEAIKTITPPYSAFVGQLIIIPTGAFTTATTTASPDNIMVAATAAANVPVLAVYDGTFWYIK